MTPAACTATSTPTASAEPPASPTARCLLPDGEIDDSANDVLPQPPVAPVGRSYRRRRDSIVLMHTKAQAEELASADATTTKTLDDIEALLTSLKTTSMVSAPKPPAPLDMPAAVASQKIAVKSRFMDYSNNAAAEGGTVLKFRGPVKRHSSCAELSCRISSRAAVTDDVGPGSPITPTFEAGCLTRDPSDSPLLSPRGGLERPAVSLAAVKLSRSSITSGGDSCCGSAGPAVVEFSGSSFSSGGKALSPTNPFQQLQPRQGMAGGMPRPPPRRNTSCSLLPSSSTSPLSHASSLMVTPRISSESSQVAEACHNNDDADSDGGDDGVQLTPEASVGASGFWSIAAAARRGSVFLPGSVGAATAEPGRSSLPSGIILGAQANMKQPSAFFFANALAARRASSSTNLGRPQIAVPLGGVMLPSIGVSNCATQSSIPKKN